MRNLARLALMLIALTVSALQSGCTSSSELNCMTAPNAWTELESNTAAARLLEKIFGYGLSDATVQAEQDAKAASQGSSLTAEAIDRMVDDMAAHFVESLPKLVADQQYQAVLWVGEFSSDESANSYLRDSLESVVAKLKRNEQFKNSFAVVDRNKKALEDVLVEVGGSINTDPRGRTADRTKNYSPEYVYVLTGSYVAVPDPGSHSLTTRMRIKVVHAQSRIEEDSVEFPRKFIFHPGPKYKRYITVEESDAIPSSAECAKKPGT